MEGLALSLAIPFCLWMSTVKDHFSAANFVSDKVVVFLIPEVNLMPCLQVKDLAKKQQG